MEASFDYPDLQRVCYPKLSWDDWNVRVARCRSKVFGERERAVAEMVNGRLPGGEIGVGVWSRRVTCTAQTSH